MANLEEMSLVEDGLVEDLDVVERMRGSRVERGLVEVLMIGEERPQEEVLHASSVEEALLVHQEAAIAFVVAFLQVVRHELEEELPVEGLKELLLLVVDHPRT